jgi:hypothetical protein
MYRSRFILAFLASSTIMSGAMAAGDDLSTLISFGCGEPGLECCTALAATRTARPATSTPSKSADAATFFAQLVERYRSLEAYKDTARLVETTHREGKESNRVETTMACEVASGELKIDTPTRQVRDALGVDLPVKSSPPMKESKRKFDLWLAPHMALKFTETPLKQFRAGVEEGFTATGVETITIDDKEMLHVSLRSGDGLSEDCDAKFDLYVNRASMLIERIDGEQRLPDGASYCTTLHITPVEADDSLGEPAAR